MLQQYIVYSIAIYFVGLLVSTILSLKDSKKALWLFVGANIVGLSAGIVYFAKFFGQTIVIANLNWFFDFKPTLTLLSAIFFTLVGGVSALVGAYSTRYLELYSKTYNKEVVGFLMALFALGMQGVLLANNVFVFMFCWEVMSVASFFLVMADKSQESIKAAFLYFIMTHLGASAILGGFLILGNGNLLFELSQVSQASAGLSVVSLGLAFSLFLFGFGSKAGLAPFHVWLPEAHPQAPSNISAMMSGLMLKVAVYGFIRVVFGFVQFPSWAAGAVLALGILSALLGVLNAVIEKDIKRAFAFSSIENMGIIFTMLGLSLYTMHLSGDGMNAITQAIVAYAIFHAISHAFFKTALFLSSGVVMSRVHTKNMNEMGGIAKLMPVFSFAFLLAILSSLPIAPFGTFFGEWGFVQNIIKILHQSQTEVVAMIVAVVVLAVVGLVGGLAVFAMTKIFAISMLGLPRAHHMEMHDEKNDYMLIVPIAILAAGVLGLGLFARSILLALMNNASGVSFAQTSSQGMTLSSVLIFAVMIFLIILVIAAKKLVIGKQKERMYHTWDCGQPINATMEYSATAFSAPIRFFFLNVLRRYKKIDSVPVIETNPWIRSYSFSLVYKSVWKDAVYVPIAKSFVLVAEKIKAIQSGRIQYYLVFLLVTLIVTLMIVL